MDRKKIFFEGEFISKLLELQYFDNVTKDFTDCFTKTKKLSKKVKWAKGWPDNDKSFWNAEAFMWEKKIGTKKRELIKEELLKLLSNRSCGKNLDLGAGAYSYIPSIAFDFSEKMLNNNENAIEKVIGDLDEKLPFEDNCFDSVTAIFVFNYVKNLNNLLNELKRVLKENGVCVVVQNMKPINFWHKNKERNDFTTGNEQNWEKYFSDLEFQVNISKKDGLVFFKLIKR